MFEIKNMTFLDVIHIENLTIQENKITSIIGPSGSGKSTFLKTLNLLITPQYDYFTYNNQDILSYKPNVLRREVAMLPQTPHIYPGTIKDNLLIGFTFKKENTPEDKKLHSILNQVQLSKNLEEDTSNLSGGEKQRLALARLLLLKPSVLLLDEPSSALDKNLEEEIMEIIHDYHHKNHITIIMITHSPDIAYKYSNTVLTITAGKLEKSEVIQ